jgi:hypothetical protein
VNELLKYDFSRSLFCRIDLFSVSKSVNSNEIPDEVATIRWPLPKTPKNLTKPDSDLCLSIRFERKRPGKRQKM